MRRARSIVLVPFLLAALAPAAEGQTRGGFDSSGHLLMHGTRRFVLGVYDSGGGYSTDSAFWENAIFAPSGPRGLQGFPLNVYLNYFLGGMPIDSTTALLDVLQSHGLMYLQTGNCAGGGSWLRYGPNGFSIASWSYVQQFSQHPAALGYYIMDECDDALIPETTQHYQQLKTWDPQGISLATTIAAAYRDPGLWTNAADVLAIDPYPLYGPEPSQGYPHFIVADFTAKLRSVARAGRPIWSVLQFFQFTTDSRPPTSAEMRAHAVMAIVEGAQGLFWWDIGVNGLQQLDAATVATYMGYLKTLTTELAGLEPALLAASANGALVGNTTRFSDPVAGRIAQLQHNIAVETVFSRVQADQAEMAALQAGDTSKSPLLVGAANVRTRTKVVNGLGYVFAYNYTNSPQPVTFTWHSPIASVTESQSGQSFAVSSASWSDTFGPYQARIYIVQGATPPGPPTPRDFNGDGKSDILWRDTAGNVALWLMNGATIASNSFLMSVPTTWTPVGNGSKDVGDFNGDGKADILWGDTSGNLALWLMNGATIVSNTFVGNVPTDWTPVRIGDFDGDGNADILWRETSGNVAVWLMNGATVVANRYVTNMSTAWTPVGAGDFNGDGTADILWRDTSGNVAVWLMNGTTIITNRSLMNMPTDWTLVGIGDFNGDGTADILWRDTRGNLEVWLMNGAAVAAVVDVAQVSKEWTPVGVADFNGDGKADILWRDTSGNVAVWLMDGTAIVANSFITNVPITWTTQ